MSAFTLRKKLIEVALPLDAINKASAHEKSIRHGHPSTLHLWWARRPLAAARAVIFAQMVDDPSSHPDIFKTPHAQEKERQRLFRLIEELVLWENSTNEELLERARAEIWQSWRSTCADYVDYPSGKDLFNRHKLPSFYDPFAGGGALPLEAQRLGLESYASDLNPVAVLINKIMIEVPPQFAGFPPVNPPNRSEKTLATRQWRGAQGLAEDVRYYGEWMRKEAERRVGPLYPKVEITAEMSKERPDLKPLVGKTLTVIAWLWARTVKSPNPAFAEVHVPLTTSFMLYSKTGKEVYVEPIIEKGNYLFEVRAGKPKNAEAAKNGTKLARGANFKCVMSGAPINGDYIKAEGQAGRIGSRLMAVVVESDRGRVYLSPSASMEAAAGAAAPVWKPDVVISGSTQYLGVKPYGMEEFSALFTERQLLLLSTFADLVSEAREQVHRDALSAGLNGDLTTDGGRRHAESYADAVAMYLGVTVSKISSYHCTLGVWRVPEGKTGRAFGRQAMPMVWDFPECNPFAGAGGDWDGACSDCAKVLENLGAGPAGHAWQAAAQSSKIGSGVLPVVSTDPPYYDNVPYADLSDFFYVWLRRALKSIIPDLFSTVAGAGRQ